MRRSREAKPPRCPRVITWRLVLVSLVVGVVLAVVSVVVGAAYARGGTVSQSVPDPWARYFNPSTGTTYRVRRGTTWSKWAGQRYDQRGGETAVLYARFTGATRLDRSPLPSLAQKLPAGGWRRVEVLYAGWPWRTTYGMTEYLSWQTPSPSVGLLRFHAMSIYWALPYLPFWPGLLGNTLFYGLLVLPLLALSRRHTLRRRARRGLCLACAYELGEGVEACPECGLARAGVR